MKPTDKSETDDELIPTNEQFRPEFGVTVHGRTKDGVLRVTLPKPRVTGVGILSKYVKERMAEERAKAEAEKKEE